MEGTIRPSLSCETTIIFGELIADSAWERTMQKDGLVILFMGADLEKFRPNGSLMAPARLNQHSPSAYLALGLTGEEDANALRYHTSGFPHRDLFFECLKPWSWFNKETKDIVIHEANIVLNVSEYYRIPLTSTAMTNVSDARRLSGEKPDIDTAKWITDKHYTHAISNGKRNIERILLFHYGDKDDCVFILVFLGSTKLVWSFIPARVDTEH